MEYIPKHRKSQWRAYILFTTATGVRQLFNILLELVLRLAIQDEKIGAKVQEQYINKLRFVDDTVL